MAQKFSNIANDQVAHSQRMNNVIDHMISSLNSTLPGNKEKYIGMLDSYCARDDDQSVKEADLIDSDDFYADEEEFTPHKSDWNARKRYVEGRPRGWLRRFTSDSSRVRKDPPLNCSASMPGTVMVTLKEPVKPRIYEVCDLESFKDATLQSNFCLTCWNLVTVGPTRICCEHCPVVIHRYCISNLSDYFVDDTMQPAPSPPQLSSVPAPTLSQSFRANKRENERSHTIKSLQTFRRDKSHQNRRVIQPHVENSTICENDDSPTSPPPTGNAAPTDNSVRKVFWVCPFCVHEVNVGNDFNTRKYQRSIALHRAKKSVILIQSILRMAPQRRHFAEMVAASKAIQRFHRSRNFRRALIKERTNQKRAVRIRLHQLTLYAIDSEAGSLLPPLPDASIRVFGMFGANMFPKNIQEVEKAPITRGTIAALCSGSEGRRNQSAPAISKKVVMLELIKESSSGSSMNQLQMPVKDMNGAPFPPKTLFLTLTTCRMEAGQVKQLYRIDIPMREIAPRGEKGPQSTNAPQNDGHFCNYEVVRETAALLDGDESTRDFIKLKIYPPKHMVLLPALPANVTIYMTVSEVVDWPRAYLIGQSVMHGDHYLIWRQVVTLSQGLSACDIEDLPKGDSHSRLQIHMPASNIINDDDGVSRCSSSDGGSAKRGASPNKTKTKPLQFMGGRILWTLIPSSFVASIAGPLFFLPQPSIASSKKRCWCVVLEGCLIVYGHMTDIRTKETIDLSVCTVHMLEAEVIKIHRSKSVDVAKRPDQTWFCFCATANLRPEWYKILKENSLRTRKTKKAGIDVAALLLS